MIFESHAAFKSIEQFLTQLDCQHLQLSGGHARTNLNRQCSFYRWQHKFPHPNQALLRSRCSQYAEKELKEPLATELCQQALERFLATGDSLPQWSGSFLSCRHCVYSWSAEPWVFENSSNNRVEHIGTLGKCSFETILSIRLPAGNGVTARTIRLFFGISDESSYDSCGLCERRVNAWCTTHTHAHGIDNSLRLVEFRARNASVFDFEEDELSDHLIFFGDSFVDRQALKQLQSFLFVGPDIEEEWASMACMIMTIAAAPFLEVDVIASTYCCGKLKMCNDSYADANDPFVALTRFIRGEFA